MNSWMSLRSLVVFFFYRAWGFVVVVLEVLAVVLVCFLKSPVHLLFS